MTGCVIAMPRVTPPLQCNTHLLKMPTQGAECVRIPSILCFSEYLRDVDNEARKKSLRTLFGSFLGVFTTEKEDYWTREN